MAGTYIEQVSAKNDKPLDIVIIRYVRHNNPLDRLY